MKTEVIIFLAVNVFVPILYVWTLGATVSNELKFITALLVSGLILGLNIWRFQAVPIWRVPYAIISTLNIVTLIAIGNIAFIPSVFVYWKLIDANS